MSGSLSFADLVSGRRGPCACTPCWRQLAASCRVWAALFSSCTNNAELREQPGSRPLPRCTKQAGALSDSVSKASSLAVSHRPAMSTPPGCYNTGKHCPVL